MKKIIYTLIPITLLFACSKPEKIEEITGFAQGTTYSIKYWQEGNTKTKESLSRLVSVELKRIDKLMSNYRDDSDIEIFNANKIAADIEIDKEIIELLKKSKEVYKLSEGCYDPTIKPIFNIWGFKKDKFNQPTEEQLTKIVKSIGFDKVELKETTINKGNKGITVDLSAIGQGYAIQKLSEIFKKETIGNYIIEIGGEMLVAGKKPNASNWRVAVERPVPESKKINKVITIKSSGNVAIMTSGTYRHYFDSDGKRFSHILNPLTGKPVSHNTVSTTVLMSDASMADAWSTALLCLGKEKGLEIANKNNIPVIFFTMDKENNLKETSSKKINQVSEWEIK